MNSSEFVFNENVSAGIDFQKEAQLVTKWVADREEAKTIHMLVDKMFHGLRLGTSSFASEAESMNQNSSEFIFNDDANVNIDYQKEAQSLTKWVADQEEAKVVQQLIDEGKLAENR